MSDIIKTGGPAFPRSSQGPSGDLDMAFGMELRDWFAGMALQGYIASVTQLPDAEDAAEDCYRYADAMLVEREKGTKNDQPN